MNITPENVPDETLLQAKVVHVPIINKDQYLRHCS